MWRPLRGFISLGDLVFVAHAGRAGSSLARALAGPQAGVHTFELVRTHDTHARRDTYIV